MDTMKELLGSKKFRVAVATIVVLVATALGFAPEDPMLQNAMIELLLKLVAGVGAAYIGAQGIADAGKSAEKLRQAERESDRNRADADKPAGPEVP